MEEIMNWATLLICAGMAFAIYVIVRTFKEG